MFSGSLRPNEALNTFDNGALSGTKRVTIQNFGEQTGSLTEWCLIPTTSGAQATPGTEATHTPTPGSQATPTAGAGPSILYLPLIME